MPISRGANSVVAIKMAVADFPGLPKIKAGGENHRRLSGDYI